MNRLERRQYANKGGINPYELQAVLNRERAALEVELRAKTKETIDNVVNDMCAAVVICLHDKLGFGATRAQRFASEVNEVFDNIQLGLVNIEEIKQTIQDELGIAIM